MSELKAGVGLSRKWDAREAGREVAETALEKLEGEKPKFFLLFSTIHYEKYGGFQELLNGVWEVLPEGTPLIGGTVAGFMNNYGCFARGATALTVAYPNMDVAVGVGQNTKRNPRKAAREVIESLGTKKLCSDETKKLMVVLVSGPEAFYIPGLGQRKVLNEGFVSKQMMKFFSTSQYLFQKGLGREDELFEELTKIFPDTHMVLGTTTDDYQGLRNYQFFGKEVLRNGVIALLIFTQYSVDVQTTHGMKETGKKFHITGLSRDGHIIFDIDHKPAREALLQILGWPEDLVDERTVAFTFPYYPISFRRGKKKIPVVIPGIIGDAIVTTCKVDKGEADIMTTSGYNLIQTIEKHVNAIPIRKPHFGIISACMTILQTLGYKVESIRKILLDYFHSAPFLLIWCAGEGTYSPSKGSIYANMSLNSAIIGKE